MHRLQLVLEKALGRKIALPKRKLKSIEEFIESFPEVKRVILDGTERPIQRAKDQEKQKQDYSGKKKRHTRTHLGAVAPDRSILVFIALRIYIRTFFESCIHTFSDGFKFLYLLLHPSFENRPPTLYFI